jgi:hypothetical protein
MRALAAVVGTVLLLQGGPVPVAAQEPVFSGPQAGELLPPLVVRVLVGPGAGEQPDLIAQANGQPVLLVFVHERTRPAFGLANMLMRFAESRHDAGLKSALIYLTDDATATENWVKGNVGYFSKASPVGISLDGAEGPGAYGLNRNVGVTVLVGRQGTVTENFALVQPSIQADGPKILKAVVEVTGGGDVPEVTTFLSEGMRSRMMSEQRPAGAWGPQDARLRELLRAVIAQEASAEQVGRAVEAVEAYVATNAAARRELGEISTRVVGSDQFGQYGTEPARKAISKWSEQYGPTAPASPKPEASSSSSPSTASRDG